MAYETEKTRLLNLLALTTGINRTRNGDLTAAADKRAIAAYRQVGTEGSVGISHPTQMERESMLGAQWAGKGVAEIASWNYLWTDPVGAAANGFLTSPVHRAVLDDPRFKHWGAGIYTHLPSGATEIHRRWYFIIWLSITVPEEAPVAGPTFKDVPVTHKFYSDIEWTARNGIARGLPDGTYRPDAAVTRGQMAAFTRRLYNLIKSGG